MFRGLLLVNLVRQMLEGQPSRSDWSNSARSYGTANSIWTSCVGRWRGFWRPAWRPKTEEDRDGDDRSCKADEAATVGLAAVKSGAAVVRAERVAGTPSIRVTDVRDPQSRKSVLPLGAFGSGCWSRCGLPAYGCGEDLHEFAVPPISGRTLPAETIGFRSAWERLPPPVTRRVELLEAARRWATGC